MATTTLQDRLIEQMAPIGPLLSELVDEALANSTIQHVSAAFPLLRRLAHLSRLSGTAGWALVADGLVDVAGRDQLPEGFGVLTTDAEHNAGRYSFRFPGGVFTFRRLPHDDEKEEGLFLQQSFKELIDLLDAQGAPEADEVVRVWIQVAPGGRTRLTARDRHNHEVVVTLADLVSAWALPTASHPSSGAAPRTRVRSTRVDKEVADE